MAIIGSLVLGVVESALAAWVAGKGEPDPGLLPGLAMADVGRVVLTHLLLWCPLMAACGSVVSAFWRRAAAPPEPLLWALFVAMAGSVVVLADLTLVGARSRVILVVACLGVALSAGTTYVAIFRIRRRLGATRLRRVRNVVTGTATLLTIACGGAFARSPLMNPSGYRVPPGPVARPSPDRPNVLWIVLDTVRADRLGCYGSADDTTPFLDDWAGQAIVFERAVANGIWTLPTHASMFSGLSLREHGVHANYARLDSKITTVAEVLGAAGYATGSFSNNPLINGGTNLAQGFNVRRTVKRRLSRFSLEFLCERWGVTPVLPWLDGDSGAALTNQLVARWIDQGTEDKRPFFLFVNYMEAHLPYRIPKPYRRMFMTEAQVDRSYDLRWRVFGDISSALNARFNIEGSEFVTQADHDVVKRQYLAAIRYLDDRVGEMIEIFQQRGLLNNTLVVITSDHGEYLDTHGMWSHCFHTYNDVTLVPLLVREPGRTRGLRVATLVQLSDLYPTVVNAALGRFDSGPGYGSRDLITLAEAGGPLRQAYIEYRGPGPSMLARVCRLRDPALTHRAQPQLAVVDGPYKYIASGDGQRELYNVLADPGEQHNLANVYPRTSERLAAYLAEWHATVPKYERPESGGGSGRSSDLNDVLRSLGYVDNSRALPSQRPQENPD